jgi:hypothetical protein
VVLCENVVEEPESDTEPQTISFTSTLYLLHDIPSERRTHVVLPAPRNPVMSSTGTVRWCADVEASGCCDSEKGSKPWPIGTASGTSSSLSIGDFNENAGRMFGQGLGVSNVSTRGETLEEWGKGELKEKDTWLDDGGYSFSVSDCILLRKRAHAPLCMSTELTLQACCRRFTEAEVGCSDQKRFEAELEFIQGLSSPQYINCED